MGLSFRMKQLKIAILQRELTDVELTFFRGDIINGDRQFIEPKECILLLIFDINFVENSAREETQRNPADRNLAVCLGTDVGGQPSGQPSLKAIGLDEQKQQAHQEC